MTTLVICSQPGCQTTAGCKCANVLTFDGRSRYRGDPTIIISFNSSGCWARKQWPLGHFEDISVTEAMREFDKLPKTPNAG